MLLCDQAILEGTRKPQKIICEKLGGPCVHVRYCAVSMKYYQTDAALKCLARDDKTKQSEK